jgi:hypothetical protein
MSVTTWPVDGELQVVRRAFEAAFRRECECTDPDRLQDELSNMLHHTYRLGELLARRWKALESDLTKADYTRRLMAVPGALGALWIRCYDTHQVASVTTLSSVYSDVYTALYGVLTWQPLSVMTFINLPKEIQRSDDYQEHLATKPVLDTLKAVFNGMADLLLGLSQ